MQWSQLHRHHRPRNLPTPSGWSGLLPQRKLLIQLQLRFLKCHKKRTLDAAREQYFTPRSQRGVAKQTLDFVLHRLIYLNWHSQPIPHQDWVLPLWTKQWTLSLRKSCCGKMVFFKKVMYWGSNFFLKKGHFMLYLLHCYYCLNSYLQLHLQSCCFFAGVSFLEKLVTAFAYSLCRALISFEEVPNDIN